MSYNLSPVYQTSQLDDNGNLLVGGLLYWYQAGTTSPIPVYQDNLGSATHTNPIVLDARGEPPAPIWLNASFSYKAVLKTSAGVQLQVIDNIVGVLGSTTVSGTLTSLSIDSTGDAATLSQTAVGNLVITTDTTGTPEAFTFGSDGDFTAKELVASNGIFVNKVTVASDYSIPAGYNGMSAGPVTVNSGVTVTVPSGSVWTIV